jgi:predicted unusual protein kinase regulating ubiquinone biosynthesis (AarF/ABC1/UbiB family)
MNGQSSIAGRVRRYARVSTAMGGLAARLAGERYLGLSLDRARHASDLRQALGGIKGPLMKVAQLLATIPEALPEDYARELVTLQADAPAMGWSFVKRRMASELGPDWERKFSRFAHEAAHAASLGQVHRARGRDGAELACKLQYPDMASAVEADLNQLKLVLSLYEHFDRALSTDEIHAEIAERLREELDYAREAAHLRLYRAILKDEKLVTVPEPVASLSTRRLLTMNWLDGKPLLELAEASQERRDAIAIAMFRAWYVPFYNYGAIHGDPHLGNYTVRGDDGINLFDLGCVRIFPARFVKGVIDLYRAFETGDGELAVSAYENWGFKNLNREMVAVLNRWARFLYAPLLDDRKREIDDDQDGNGRAVAAEVHREVRRLGGVKPPREFVFMDRAAVGLGSVFMHLRASINWHRLFNALIEDFDVDALAKRQAKALRTAAVPAATDGGAVKNRRGR